MMTKDEIREATREQLRLMIAQLMGWHWTRGTTCASDPTIYRWFQAPGVMKNFPKANGTEPMCRDPLLDVPDWPNIIGLAWELLHSLEPTYRVKLQELPARAGTRLWQAAFTPRKYGPLLDGLSPPGIVFANGETPEVAICRAWLLAKLANHDPA